MSKNTVYDNEVETKTASNAHGFLKLLSVILLAGMIVGLFVPVYFSFADNVLNVHQNATILGGESTVFTLLLNTITAFVEAGEFTLHTVLRLVWRNKYLIGLAVAIVLMVITTLLTLVTRKAAPVWFRLTCVIAFVAFAAYGGNILADGAIVFDIFMIVGVVATLFMIINALSYGKKAFAPVLSFIAIVAALVLAVMFNFYGEEGAFAISAGSYFLNMAKDFVLTLTMPEVFTSFAFPVVETYQMWAYIAFAAMVVNAVFTAIQMGLIKSNFFTFLRYLAQVVVSVITIYMAYTAMNLQITDLTGKLLYLVIFAACGLGAFLFTVIAMLTRLGKKKEVADEETDEMDEIVAEPAPAAQPAYAYPAPAQTAAPNVYITINNPGTATTASAPVVETTAPVAVAAPVAVKEEPVAEKAAPKKKDPKKKKRSFCLFLALVAALAAAGVFVYNNLELVKSYLDFAAWNFSNQTFLMVGGFLVAIALGSLIAIISLMAAGKFGAFLTFVLYTAGAVAIFAYTEIELGGIIAKFTALDWMAIIVMVCAAIAVLFSFFGLLKNGNIKKEKKAKQVETVEETPVEAVAEAPVAEAPATAPVAEEEEEEETDAFLRTLTPAEKREFNKVFLAGKAPAFLPQYKVGSNNDKFFDSIFVYLGKTRTLMSDELLGKIYDYMMDNK